MNLDILKNHNTQLVLVSAASLAVGGYVSYAYTNKHAEVKYSEIAEREIEEAKRFYRALGEQTQKPATPGEAFALLHPEIVDENMDTAVEALTSYSSAATDGDLGSVTLETVRETVVIQSNIFETEGRDEDEFDLATELENRDTTRPYLISEEEWQTGEPGYDQISLTFYEGDSVLADDQDQPVEDIAGVIGDYNLGRFGVATGDANTMFIRNEKFRSDYEVVRSDGKYSHEVLGLQHSMEDHRPGVRKFRDRD